LGAVAVTIQQIRRDRIGVVAVGRLLEALRHLPLNPLLAHQPADALLADGLAILLEVFPQARPTILLAAGRMERAELGPQHHIA
jgi:hypothetical protein